MDRAVHFVHLAENKNIDGVKHEEKRGNKGRNSRNEEHPLRNAIHKCKKCGGNEGYQERQNDGNETGT